MTRTACAIAFIVAVARGGRPMARLEYRFTDVVSGRPVYLWRDRFSRLWLAESSNSRFRVSSEYGPGFDLSTARDQARGAG